MEQYSVVIINRPYFLSFLSTKIFLLSHFQQYKDIFLKMPKYTSNIHVVIIQTVTLHFVISSTQMDLLAKDTKIGFPVKWLSLLEVEQGSHLLHLFSRTSLSNQRMELLSLAKRYTIIQALINLFEFENMNIYLYSQFPLMSLFSFSIVLFYLF